MHEEVLMMDLLHDTDDQIKDYLANGNESARKMLDDVPPNKLRVLAFDLDDMKMSGAAIYSAFSGFCHKSLDKFIDVVAVRDPALIDYLLDYYPDVRAHGEQKTIPKVDQAIKNIVDEAKQQATLTRMDEGAAYIQNFFRTALSVMQQQKSFVGNYYLNMDNGVWGHFQFRFTGLYKVEGDNFVPMTADDFNAKSAEEKPASTLVESAEGLKILPKDVNANEALDALAEALAIQKSNEAILNDYTRTSSATDRPAQRDDGSGEETG
jgi:hypothetical protein